MEQAQATFEGWAIVELMGHQKEIGYVSTEYYGAAALFRIDSPEIPEREFTLERPEYIDDGNDYRHVPAGTKVKRQSIPAKSRLVSPGALYALNPCTEDAARLAIEKAVPRRLILLDIPGEVAANRALPPPTDDGYEEVEEFDEEEDDQATRSGHMLDGLTQAVERAGENAQQDV